MQMDKLLLILPAVAAGLLQGLTGFGSGIVLAMVYPYLIGVTHTAAMNQALALLICASNAFRYRRYIRWKALIRPVALYMPLFFVALMAARRVDVSTLKPLLGVFLILLSVYFLCFSGRIHLHPNWRTELICVAMSAVVDAFWGLGGPAMAVYFLSVTEHKEAYLGILQSFFLAINVYSVGVRVLSGGFPTTGLAIFLWTSSPVSGSKSYTRNFAPMEKYIKTKATPD